MATPRRTTRLTILHLVQPAMRTSFILGEAALPIIQHPHLNIQRVLLALLSTSMGRTVIPPRPQNPQDGHPPPTPRPTGPKASTALQGQLK